MPGAPPQEEDQTDYDAQSPTCTTDIWMPGAPSEEEGQTEDYETQSATCTTDIYGSVVVAAFGGVKQDVLKSENDIKVHCIFLFGLMLPLFYISINAIDLLRLDFAQNGQRYIRNATDLDVVLVDEVPHDPLLVIKLLMVLVLQLMLFGKLKQTLNLFIFILNPASWFEIARPSTAYQWSMYAGKCVAPFALMALACKIVVIYLVLCDSVSIVLAADTAKDAIFDCLSLTFLADLGDVWWPVVQNIFHFNDFSSFAFKKASQAERDTMAKKWSCLPQCLLRRGRGTRRLETFVTFLVLACMYQRQAFVLLHALDTNILPMVRDVCTQIRLERRNRVFSLPLIADVSNIFAKLKLNNYCDAESEKRLQLPDVRRLMRTHPKSAWSSIICLVLFLVLPQCFYAFNSTIRSIWSKPSNSLGSPEGAAGDTEAAWLDQVEQLLPTHAALER